MPRVRYARSSLSNAKCAWSGTASIRCSQTSTAAGEAPFLLAGVSQIQVRGCRARVGVDRFGKRACRRRLIAGSFLRAPDLVAQEAENLLVVGAATRVDVRDSLADLQRVDPLVLILVELLQVDEGIAVQWIELQYSLERLECPVHESSVPKIKAQAEQHVRVLQFGEVGSLQERLVDSYRAAHLPFFAVQVAQNHLDLERLGFGARGRA